MDPGTEQSENLASDEAQSDKTVGLLIAAQEEERTAKISHAIVPGNSAAAGQPLAEPEPGSVIDGKYKVVSLLGKGGMSSVYLVWHTSLRMHLALKLMHPHLGADETSIKRFQQEGELVNKVHHPHVMAVTEFSTTADGQPYMVMEYLQGRSLAELIKSEGKLEPARALKIFTQACDALQHAHEALLVHRDLKPSNIMLVERDGDPDFVKIVDFGIAKLLNDGSPDRHQLTRTGEIFGSPSYMSPEQCEGKGVDGRSDIYSLGCLMYETLTGRLPFVGDNLMEVLYKHLNEAPENFSADFPDQRIRQPLELIVFSAMAKQPEKRYQSMQRLGQDIELFLQGQNRGAAASLLALWHLWQLRRGPRSSYVSLKVVAYVAIATCIITAASLPIATFISFSQPKSFYLSQVWRAVNVKTERQLRDRIAGDSSQETLVPRAMLKGLSRFGGSDPDVEAENYRKLARIKQDFGDYPEAQRFLRKAMKLANVNVDNMQSRLDTALPMQLANCYYWQGQFEQARDIYEKCFYWIERTDEQSSATSVSLLKQLCDIYVHLKYMDNPVNVPKLERMLGVLESACGRCYRDSPDMADVYCQIKVRQADLVSRRAEQQSDRAGKAALLSEALQMLQGSYRTSLGKMAAVGKKELAVALIGEAVTLKRLADLGVDDNKNRHASIEAYAKAVDIIHDSLEDNEPSLSFADYATAVSNYSDFLWQSGEWAQALAARGQAIELNDVLRPKKKLGI